MPARTTSFPVATFHPFGWGCIMMLPYTSRAPPDLMLVKPSHMRRLVVIGAAIYLIVLVWAITYLPERLSIDKSPGWSGSSTVPEEVVSVDPQGEAAGKLQVGDKILALDNDHQFSVAFGPTSKLREYAPGAPYTLTILRHGQLARVTLVVPARASRPPVSFLVAYFAGSAGFLACGIILGWKRPDDRTAQLGWLACTLTAFFYIHFLFWLFTSWSEPPVFWFIGLVDPGHLFVTYCFIASFGASGPESRGWRRLRAALGILCIAPYIHRFPRKNSPFEAFFDAVTPHWILSCLAVLGSAAIISLAAAMVAVLIRNYRAATSAIDRRRLEIVAGAIVGTLVILSVSTTIQAIYGGTLPLTLGNLAPLPIPICFCYAVVAHQVLDIRLVVRRGLQYLLARQVLRILGLLPLIAIVVMALRHPDAPMRSAFNLTGLGLIFLVALGLEFRDKIQLSVDRWFLRERFDREKLIRALLAEIASAESFPHVAALVDTRLRSIYSAEFVDIRDTEESIDLSPAGGISLAFTGPGGDTAGWLVLGPRRSDEPYAPADVELIDLVASQVGLMRHMFLVSARAADVTYAVQEERTRIAQELHDTVEQGFAGISLYLAAAGRSMQDSPGQASAYLEAARKLAKTSAKETRDSVRGIRSSDLATGGNLLEARLRRIAERFMGESTDAPRVALDLPPGICELASDDAGWHLARVAEEAVTNACKHASANEIQIGVHTDGRLLKLTIKDDGAGFEPRHTSKSGFGLQGMRERMGHVLGAVEIISSPGHGTEVRALVPIATVSA